MGRHLWAVVVLLLAGLSLSACGTALRASPEAPQAAPASLERIQGSDLSRVKLTAKSAERIGIKTEHVRDLRSDGSAATAVRKVVPYGAVLYDADNKTWVYTNPEPFVYVRHRITVDHIDRNDAVLTEGPNSGTAVVAVGAAELYGIEFETRRQ
jgi:hypothetical protein